MCFMLYIATDSMLAEQTRRELTIEAIAPEVEAGLAPALSKPYRRFVGVDGGCSCDFPHLLSELPPECVEQVLGSDVEPGRQQQKRCVAALAELVDDILRSHQDVELYASWAGQEATPPGRRVDLRLADLAPESFYFIEQELYVVRR